MKYFKFLLINIIAFSFLFFVISLLFPGRIITSKTVSINSSKGQVLQKINATGDWKKWNAFVNETDVVKNTATTIDTLQFAFKNNRNEPMQSRFILYGENNNSIVVNWDLTEQLPWYKPWKKFSAMVLSKDFAIAMDSSLHTFKIQAEANE